VFNFDNTYINLPETFYQKIKPSSASSPQLIAFNKSLATELGAEVDKLDEQFLTDIFSGQSILSGSEPIALAYAGHQFGHFVPSLGDGRAVLLGEIIATDGKRYDIQLKGAGQTSFSRRGDGRSALGPVIREYILSEAIHALNIPTTRALAAVTSGEMVRREGILPGGIFTRVASSHIRIGTFEYFAYKKDYQALKQLADYAINRHYPELNTSKTKYFEFLQAVSRRKLSLVAKWMGVGFIHGVMNTDNSSISGETIDFGPCAFMDHFRYDKVFSSIDRDGRYAYHNQGNIALWNLSSLAQCLIPLMGSDTDEWLKKVKRELDDLSEFFLNQWIQLMGQKLGIFSAEPNDQSLINQFLSYLEKENLDYTNSFNALYKIIDKSMDENDKLVNYFTKNKEFEQFFSNWKARLQKQSQDISKIKALMVQNNPVFIPRNHQVEKAISYAIAGQYDHFHQLLTVLSKPFTFQEEFQDFMAPPQEDEVIHQTFCGT